MLSLHRQTVWRWTREGRFPQPVCLGGRSKRWRLSEIEAWAQEIDGPA